MKVTPDDYGRRCQFDHFCKLVLYHEAVDYFRERKRQRGWETSFETLPLSELDTLCTIDPYPSDSFIFGPVRLRLERSPTLAAAFHFIPVFDDFGVQGNVQWEDGCLKPPAQQRIGNALYANTFLAIVQ